MNTMENHLKVASVVANMLDNQFNFFGFRFGLNGLLGLIPGAGDFITTALSAYIVWIGYQMGLPFSKLIEMVGNVSINFFIGLLPVVGDAVDFFHKANLKNLRILQDYAKEHGVVEGEILEASHSLASR
jgi:hypothetical protein